MNTGVFDKKLVLFGALLFCYVFTGSEASAGDRYYLHWNPVVTPRTIFDYIKKCSEDAECKAAMDYLSTQLGFPSPSLINDLIPARSGEVFRYYFRPNNGHRICRVMWKVISANTATFSVTIRHNGNQLDFYSYVRRKGLGKGRSWVDAAVVVTTTAPGETRANCQTDGILHDQRYGV